MGEHGQKRKRTEGNQEDCTQDKEERQAKGEEMTFDDINQHDQREILNCILFKQMHQEQRERIYGGERGGGMSKATPTIPCSVGHIAKGWH